MNQEIVVEKVLNNNVIIAEHPIYKEVVLIGNGIGFNRKKGDIVPLNKADKTFLLKDEKEKEQYVDLLDHIDRDTLSFMNEIIIFIEEKMEQSLSEHIHVALTDHLAFAIKRGQQGMQFSNPFFLEIETLYPQEYRVATDVVAKVEDRLGISLPEGEVGFITLHIHSAVTDKSISDINKHHQLILKMVKVIEENLEVELDRDRVSYNRLVQHLHRAIDRTYQGEKLGHQKKLADMLKITYPICYNLAWKLIKVMQKQLHRPVDETEAIYLTIHLQRLTNKI
ncbi:glucose PTS transporter transcription antiterminator GlcT [Aquibacillus albus]|uniref:Transcriptional antiterminator n=1 Tax=Aquibacillus albus TaxID=1168171 RepID=A0ABS2N4W1_9BACI|nr:PRD domain-containing protein [Aquibacillus albus]MBM7573156.1 transcriptional antiterminator [Aquibacillus albus]